MSILVTHSLLLKFQFKNTRIDLTDSRETGHFKIGKISKFTNFSDTSFTRREDQSNL